MMSDNSGAPKLEESFAALKSRADDLERQLQDAKLQAASQIRQSELKTEALRLGILDIDGLRLLDPSTTAAQREGDFDASAIVGKLRRDKPWLFGTSNSSSTAAAPVAAVTKRRLATEMTLEEWRSARADLLRRR